jgi:hypothetical protein
VRRLEPADYLVQLDLYLDTKSTRCSVCGRVRVCGGGWGRGGANDVLLVSTLVIERWLRPFSMSNLPLGFRI